MDPQDIMEMENQQTQNVETAAEPQEKETVLGEIRQEIEDLNTRFTNQLQVKDQLMDKLHQELEYYKNDTASRFENQLLKAVIKIRHNMKRNLERGALEGMSAEDLLKEYTYIYEDLTDLLEQQNCDEINSQPGDPFDASIHQAKIEKTDDIVLDKLVKLSLKEGYKKGDKVLIPERVLVYQYSK